MLSDAERNVLNTALEKCRPGQSEPILVGGENLLNPALELMRNHRLVIEEIKDAKAVTSYTRWVDADQMTCSRLARVPPGRVPKRPREAYWL